MNETPRVPALRRIEGATVLPLPVGAQAEPDTSALLIRRTHQLLRAEQQAHAERGRRRELQAQAAHASRLKDALRDALGDVAALEQRVRELEGELAQTQRMADEAARLATIRARRAAESDQRAMGLERELVEQSARTTRVRAAIAELRAELSELIQPPDLGAPSPQRSDRIEPQQLGYALLRLRETHELRERPAASLRPAGKPANGHRRWLNRVFHSLAAEDSAAAGQLLLALLPAAAVVDPRPAAYDLVLGTDAKVVVLTIAGRSVHIAIRDEPRPLSDVDFRVVGDPASIARLLRAGRLRRRLVFGLARIQGRRAALATFRSLLEAPLTLRELHAVGVRLDSVLALKIAALMIEPGWTVGERFTIAHQAGDLSMPRAFLEIRAGATPQAGRSHPAGPVTSTLVCPADVLLEVLAADPPPEQFVRGDLRPLELVGRWLERAQSG